MPDCTHVAGPLLLAALLLAPWPLLGVAWLVMGRR